LLVVDHTVWKIAALGEHAAQAVWFGVFFGGEVFVFSPTLGVDIDRLNAAIAIALRRVWYVSAHMSFLVRPWGIPAIAGTASTLAGNARMTVGQIPKNHTDSSVSLLRREG
jgi:hypothetical protein